MTKLSLAPLAAIIASGAFQPDEEVRKRYITASKTAVSQQTKKYRDKRRVRNKMAKRSRKAGRK